MRAEQARSEAWSVSSTRHAMPWRREHALITRYSEPLDFIDPIRGDGGEAALRMPACGGHDDLDRTRETDKRMSYHILTRPDITDALRWLLVL